AMERPGTGKGMARLVALVRDREAVRVVVGLPLSLAGGDSQQTEAARAFAERLEAAIDVPVELYDERLTTVQAQRAGGRADEDSRAAAHLLEAWLASQSRYGHPPD